MEGQVDCLMFKNQNVMETILNLPQIRLVKQDNKICINYILITCRFIYQLHAWMKRSTTLQSLKKLIKWTEKL